MFEFFFPWEYRLIINVFLLIEKDFSAILNENPQGHFKLTTLENGVRILTESKGFPLYKDLGKNTLKN
jgi:hypothetical protein